MECGDAGRLASASNLLSKSARILLGREHASSIIDTMKGQVGSFWLSTARSVGVSARDFNTMVTAFAYPGFDQDRQERGNSGTTIQHRSSPLHFAPHIRD